MGQLLRRQQLHSVLVLHRRLMPPRNLKRINHLGLVHLKHPPSIHPSALARMKADRLPLSHLGQHPRQLRTRILRFLLEHRQIHSEPLQVQHLAVLPHLLNRRLSPLVGRLLLQAALLLDLNLPRLRVEPTLLFLNLLCRRPRLLGVGLASARPLLPLPRSLLPFRWPNQRPLEGHYLQSVLRPPNYLVVSGRSRSCLAGATLSGSAAST
jgi:hypothetical protein